MKTDLPVTRLSDPATPATLAYYDLPIESPDGSKIVYTQFDGDAVPGPARVIVADPDGGNPQGVGHCQRAIGHVGAMPIWIDEATVNYAPEGPGSGRSINVDLDGRVVRRFDAQMRNYHPGTRRGVLMGVSGGGRGQADASRLYRLLQQLTLWSADEDRIQEGWVTCRQLHARHPMRTQFDAERSNMQNPKFSHDGSRMLVVFGTQVYRKYNAGAENAPSIKSLFVLDVAEDPNPVYLGEFGNHPLWSPDGTAILANDPLTDRPGNAITLHPVDGGAVRPLVEEAPSVHPTLDRSCRRVITDAFSYPEPDHAAVLHYDLASGARRTLASGPNPDMDHDTGCHCHPQYARDESSIFFNLADTGRSQVYRLAL